MNSRGHLLLVHNATKGTVLHDAVKEVTSLWGQVLGYMFTVPRGALLFRFPRPRNETLHMFFVFGPIDVLALSETCKVVAIRENFRPWQIWHVPESKYILELPVGTVSASKTSLGDEVTIEE